jgi:hypothetical protein
MELGSLLRAIDLVTREEKAARKGRAEASRRAVERITKRHGVAREDYVALLDRPTDDDLALLRHFPKIRSLSIQGGVETTPVGYGPIGNLSELRTIFIRQSNVYEGLKYLKDQKNLTHLFLTASKFHDEDLRHLASCPKLRALHLVATDVGDDGIAHLKDFPELEDLYLSDTKVTNVCLAHLLQLPKLRRLFLSNTRVTDAAVRQFGIDRPDVHVTR